MTNFFGDAKAMREIIKFVQLGTNELGSEGHSGLPLLKMGNLTRGSFNFNKLEFIQEGNPKLNEQYILKKGDFLFNTRNTLELVGKSAVWKDGLPNAIFNNNIMRIIFADDISSFYLSYYFEHDIGWRKLKRIATGTTSVAAIYTRDLYNVEVILPSYSEQKKIVEVLMTVDNSIEKTETLIKKYKNVKQGMMQDLLTKGIDEHGNIRSEETHEFKDSPIGRIPKEWQAEFLGDYVDIKHGYAFSGEFFTEIPNDNILLTPGNFSVDGNLDFGINTKYFTGPIPKQYLLENGDLLIVMTDLTKEMNILGNTVILYNEKNVLHNQRIGKIQIKDKNQIDKQYLLQVINSQFCKKIIKDTATGTTVRHTSPQKVCNAIVPICSYEEQCRIAEVIARCENKIQSENNFLLKLQNQKLGLMQDLLTGKVRVPLEEATG